MAMLTTPDRSRRLADVETAFRTLPERYLGADPGFDATYNIRLCDLGHTWEVRCTAHGARVRKGASRRAPDVTISTDAETWQALRAGEMSGIDAFERRRLSVTGNLDYAVGFEGMFRLPGGRPPLLQIHDVPVGRHHISTLTMGHGPDVLLLHGLGGTRASLFATAAALSQRQRVHAAGRAAPARAVHLGHARRTDPGRVLPARRQVAAGRRAGHHAVLRSR